MTQITSKLPLPPNPPLPQDPYPGAVHLQPQQQMDKAGHMDTSLKRRGRRGTCHKEKSCWPQVASGDTMEDERQGRDLAATSSRSR